MRDFPRDAEPRPKTIDKAKEARRYDHATDEAINKIRSLASTGVAELDAHPLTDVYIQELVRCEAIRLMKEGQYYRPEQIDKELGMRLNKELGEGVAKDLRRLVHSWVTEFRTQLSRATEVTERKREFDRNPEPAGRMHFDTSTLGDARQGDGQTRYHFELQERGAEEAALEGTPLYGVFVPQRFRQTFGPDFDVGFPVEVPSEGLVFAVDYNGAILTYGHGGEVERLFRAALALARRLESCFE